MDKTIGELVRNQEKNYINGNTTISKYVTFDLMDTIDRIEAYLNSKHITGDKDSMGRDKPFFDIVTAAANIWYRATDLDRKNVRIRAKNEKDVVRALLLDVVLQEFMNHSGFGSFLNDWGRILSRYGSAIVKFVEKGDELYTMVIPWNRSIVDAVAFSNAPMIEVLELTPAQLKMKVGYDQDLVDKLILAQSSRENLDKQKKDNKPNFIKVYEVHGQMPLSFLTGNENDQFEYVEQMQVLSFVASKEKGKFDDYILVKGREKKPVYMITHLIEEDGRTLSIGSVEHLFDSQWMMNHTVKQIKDQLDLASKLIFQTADVNFQGQNALSAIETGDILIHSTNSPLTQVGNNSHDISSIQNFGNQWKQLAGEITSTPDVLMGNNQPSGSAYRQTAIIQQESHSLFELMTENKGLYLERMLREYVIPFLLTKKLTNKDEITAILSENSIHQIDSRYISNKAVNISNNKLKKDILAGKIVDQPDIEAIKGQIKDQLDQQGNQRFFSPGDITWSEYFKDFEWNCEIEITNENKDKDAMLTTLNTILTTVASNPNILQDKNAQMIFNKILEATGMVSPIEFVTPVPIAPPTQQSPQNTPGGEVGGGSQLK